MSAGDGPKIMTYMTDIDCLLIIFVGTKRTIGNDIINVTLGLKAWLDDISGFLSDISLLVSHLLVGYRLYV
jgi:hypothetical protein